MNPFDVSASATFPPLDLLLDVGLGVSGLSSRLVELLVGGVSCGLCALLGLLSRDVRVDLGRGLVRCH